MSKIVDLSDTASFAKKLAQSILAKKTTDTIEHIFLEDNKIIASKNMAISGNLNDLYAPLYDDTMEICNLETITYDNEHGGIKHYAAKDGDKSALFFATKVSSKSNHIYFCTNIKDTLLINETFEKNNSICACPSIEADLEKSLVAVYNAFPGKKIIFCAPDNERIRMAAERLRHIIRVTVIPKFEHKANKNTYHDLFRQILKSGGTRTAAVGKVRQLLTGIIKSHIDYGAIIPKEAEEVVKLINFPDVKESGVLRETVENLRELLKEYKIDVKYNQMSKDIEIDIPGKHFLLDNRARNSVTHIASLCARHDLPRVGITENLVNISDDNAYNPAKMFVEKVKWDGKSRIEELAKTLDPANLTLTKSLLKRWLIGAVGCLYEPDGMAMQGCLVLQGEQGIGKTTWFWSLLPGAQHLAQESVTLNPSDRDSVKIAVSTWLSELGELDATFKKSDIAALKSFLTKKIDKIFLRYSRSQSDFPRRTAFLATVNDSKFLKDETGNRRYWVIACGKHMNARHDVDMAQVWAEAKHLYDSGEQHNLTEIEMTALNGSNRDFEEESVIMETLKDMFDWESAELGRQNLTLKEVLEQINIKVTPKSRKECARCLRELTGLEKPQKSNGKRTYPFPRTFPPGQH